MKYWKIILLSFFAGSLFSLLSLVIIREQQTQPAMRPNHGDDMVGLAYGLAVGFNIVLALCSLPVLLGWRKARHNPMLSMVLFFALPLAFTIYTTVTLDTYALLYCIPYLLVSGILFIIRTRSIRHT